ncbi:MAG: 3-deoxy-8-phosphooctulonate synthase, partial [Methylotenera sp.]
WPLHKMEDLLHLLVDLDKLVKKAGFIESTL